MTYQQLTRIFAKSLKMKGKELQKLIKNSGLKAQDLIRDSGIPEGTYFKLFNKEEVEDHFLEKLKGAGLRLSNTPKESHGPSPDLMLQMVKLMQDALDLIKKDNERLGAINESLVKNNEKLVESNTSISKLANKKIDELINKVKR